LRNSLGLGALLVGLTAVNVYYFFLRHDTSVGSLMKPVSTSKTLSDGQREALAESIPPSLLGAAYEGKKPQKPAAFAAPGANSDDNTLLGQIGPSDTLSTVLVREGFGSSAQADPGRRKVPGRARRRGHARELRVCAFARAALPGHAQG
jgi:hypothetical protein